jgi:hypothetical protein
MPTGKWRIRMTWLISDANIIIDMEAGKILDRHFFPSIFPWPAPDFTEIIFL